MMKDEIFQVAYFEQITSTLWMSIFDPQSPHAELCQTDSANLGHLSVVVRDVFSYREFVTITITP